MRWSAAAFCLLALLSVTVPRGTAAEEKTDQVLADAIDRATGGDPQTMTQACTTLRRASPRRAAPRRAAPPPARSRPRTPRHACSPAARRPLLRRSPVPESEFRHILEYTERQRFKFKLSRWQCRDLVETMCNHDAKRRSQRLLAEVRLS